MIAHPYLPLIKSITNGVSTPNRFCRNAIYYVLAILAIFIIGYNMVFTFSKASAIPSGFLPPAVAKKG